MLLIQWLNPGGLGSESIFREFFERKRSSIVTPEMAFECVVISADPAVVGTIDPLLRDFSISTSLCPDASNIRNFLDQGSTDLIVIDLESGDFSQLSHELQNSVPTLKPTVLAVSATDCAISGIHLVLRKPVTRDAGLRSLKSAYSRMLQDFRKHTRFALMKSVSATDENNRVIPLTVTNIGVGGVGMTSREKVGVGGILSFTLKLPGLNNGMSIRARVLWTRPYGAFGCEFVHIPHFDTQLLYAWLENRYRIKKPLIDL